MEKFNVGDKVKLLRVLHFDKKGQCKTDSKGNIRLYTRYPNGSRPETKPVTIKEVVKMGNRTFYKTDSKKGDIVLEEQIEHTDPVKKSGTVTLPIPRTVKPVDTFTIGMDDTSDEDQNYWF